MGQLPREETKIPTYGITWMTNIKKKNVFTPSVLNHVPKKFELMRFIISKIKNKLFFKKKSKVYQHWFHTLSNNTYT